MRKRSEVWRHFQRVDKIFTKCNYCSLKISAGGSTSALWKHLNAKHIVGNMDGRQQR